MDGVNGGWTLTSPSVHGDVVVLWREDDWRCEFHTGIDGQGRLAVYHGDTLATVESAPSGHAAHQRAEVLRQRVLRGDLRTDG